MKKIRERFTKWYIRMGYTFGYDYTDCRIYSDGIFNIPLGVPKACWICPRWVKPLLAFFSPSVYMAEVYGKAAIDGFMQGLKEADERSYAK